MELGFRLLKNIVDINQFEQANELELIQGNPGKICFQLVDASSANDCDSYFRYLPQGADVSVDVTFLDIDSRFTVTRVATQRFPDDKSVWCVDILATDQFAPNSMTVQLTSDGVTYEAILLSELRFRPTGKKTQFC